MLQLLQGHPAIPAVYGYGHLPHFEYLALELMGANVKERRSSANSRVPVKTVIGIVQQVVRSVAMIGIQLTPIPVVCPAACASTWICPSRYQT